VLGSVSCVQGSLTVSLLKKAA